jgi:HNH endonuclease
LIFDYPVRASTRRHGPFGYSEYERFRPWLRDEFDFRCVYCLERETWTKLVREFEIDHVIPVANSPDLARNYENLVYSCARCNGVKSDQSTPDPYFTLTDGTIQINSDAKAIGSTSDSLKLIRQLDLNSPRMIEWRVLKLEFERLAESVPELMKQLTRFPNDLPDLSKLRPKGNSRPNGIKLSWKIRTEA